MLLVLSVNLASIAVVSVLSAFNSIAASIAVISVSFDFKFKPSSTYFLVAAS